MQETEETHLIKRHWAKLHLDELLDEMVFHRVHFDMFGFEAALVMDLTANEAEGSVEL